MKDKIRKSSLASFFFMVLLIFGLSACGGEEPTRPIQITFPPEPTTVRPSPTATILPLQPLPSLSFATPTSLSVVVSTPVPTPTYRPTSTPDTKPGPLPPQFIVTNPTTLSKNIADWLNKQPETLPTKEGGTELARDRLRDLLLLWKAIGLQSPVEIADLDGDGSGELIATIAESWSDVPGYHADAGFLLVLKGSKTGWSSFVLRSRDLDPKAEFDFAHPIIVKVGNLIGDKQVQIVFSEQSCGASTCTLTIHVVDWNGKFTNLTPQTPALPTAQVSFEQKTGDTTTTIVLTGGTIGSVGAGPQRQATEFWRWDAATKAYKLAETRFASSFYLYYRVLDGNMALDKGDYATAIDLYNGALTDTTLKLWFSDSQGKPEQIQQEKEVLTAFSRFRLALAYALNNDRSHTLTTLQEAIAKDGKYGGWAKAFSPIFESSKSLGPLAVKEGCAAAVKFSLSNRNLIDAMNQFGYANPTFKPEDICPVLK
jgi:hypothetical protein